MRSISYGSSSETHDDGPSLLRPLLLKICASIAFFLDFDSFTASITEAKFWMSALDALVGVHGDVEVDYDAAPIVSATEFSRSAKAFTATLEAAL